MQNAEVEGRNPDRAGRHLAFFFLQADGLCPLRPAALLYILPSAFCHSNSALSPSLSANPSLLFAFSRPSSALCPSHSAIFFWSVRRPPARAGGLPPVAPSATLSGGIHGPRRPDRAARRGRGTHGGRDQQPRADPGRDAISGRQAARHRRGEHRPADRRQGPRRQAVCAQGRQAAGRRRRHLHRPGEDRVGGRPEAQAPGHRPDLRLPHQEVVVPHLAASSS